MSIAQLRTGAALAEANLLFLQPTTWSALRRIKTTYGQFIVAPEPTAAEANQLWGVQVLPTTQITAGAGLLLDTNKFGFVVVREAISLRTGTNEWSLAAGSQGIINPPAVEETIHRLGELTSFGWLGRKFDDATNIGLTTNSLSVTIELKSGAKYYLAIGQEQPIQAPNTSTPLAVVTLEGERWAFVFPPVLWPLVKEYLTVPNTAP